MGVQVPLRAPKESIICNLFTFTSALSCAHIVPKTDFFPSPRIGKGNLWRGSFSRGLIPDIATT